MTKIFKFPCGVNNDEEVLFIMRKAVGKTILPMDDVENELDELDFNKSMISEGDEYYVK